MTGRPVELSIVEQPATAMRGDYERLLDDAIAGDATLFARQDLVEAAWGIVNPLLQDPGRCSSTSPGLGTAEADQLVAEVGGWTRRPSLNGRPNHTPIAPSNDGTSVINAAYVDRETRTRRSPRLIPRCTESRARLCTSVQ